MEFDAREETVEVQGAPMEYVIFGAGKEPLVILPGLSDGLHTVRGTAKRLAHTYREFAKRYRVYAFSRRLGIPAGSSTRDMARDQAEAMAKLGIGPANVLGISQGGMIAQYLAIDHPELVKRLALAVSLAGPNETVCANMARRIDWAKSGDYRSIVLDTIRTSASPARLRIYRLAFPLLGRTGAPEDFSRFIIHANACMAHDARAELDRISCPTLVIGGDNDRNVGPGTSEELASLIPGSELHIYPNLGHAAFLEASDFQGRVIEFLRGDAPEK